MIQRCLLMTTDPGDLVLDPTCGSGTTAYVAEQWGRRWITIDTSRVALALARARIMGARYPYYLLADSPEGQRKEGEVTRTPPKETPTAWQLRSWEAYRDVARLGRKTRIGGKQREILWSIFERVGAELGRRNVVTWPGVFGALAKHASERAFDFAVVDEAQDVGIAELRFL